MVRWQLTLRSLGTAVGAVEVLAYAIYVRWSRLVPLVAARMVCVFSEQVVLITTPVEQQHPSPTRPRQPRPLRPPSGANAGGSGAPLTTYSNVWIGVGRGLVYRMYIGFGFCFRNPIKRISIITYLLVGFVISLSQYQ